MSAQLKPEQDGHKGEFEQQNSFQIAKYTERQGLKASTDPIRVPNNFGNSFGNPKVHSPYQ